MNISELVIKGSIAPYRVLKTEDGNLALSLMSPSEASTSYSQVETLFVDSIHDLWQNPVAMDYLYFSRLIVLEGHPLMEGKVDLSLFSYDGDNAIVHPDHRTVELYSAVSEPCKGTVFLGADSDLTVPEQMQTEEYKRLNRDMYWLGKLAKGDNRINEPERNPRAVKILNMVGRASLRSALGQRFLQGVRSDLPVPKRLESDFEAFRKQEN